MNIKITVTVLIAFLISFSLLYAVQAEIWNQYFTDVEDKEYLDTIDQIKSKEFSSLDKKIFIVGSSHTKQLLIDHIQETVSNEYPHYWVYNLATGGDSPKDRLGILDEIFSLNPEIVVYGIGLRDFQSITRLEESPIEVPESFLPNAKEYSETLFLTFEKSSGQDFDFLKSAQLTTLRAVREFIGTDDHNLVQIKGRNPNPMTEEELRKPRWISQAEGKIQPLHMNKEFDAFKEIIKELQNNGIKVVVFTTPHSSIFLDALPEETIEQFNFILEKTSKEFNVTIYELHDKYKRLDIWSDNTHVAYNKTGIVYSDDVAKFILKEIN